MHRAPSLVWILGVGLAALAASAEREPETDPSRLPDMPAVGTQRDGREIYSEFLANRFSHGYQELLIRSRDAGDNELELELEVRFQDNRDADGQARDGVSTKVLVEVTEPFDLRHSRYLIIDKDPGPDDQFAYLPSQRRARRIDLKRTPLLGTEFTFEDIAIRDIEDARYRRLPDGDVDGTPCYVIEAELQRDQQDADIQRSVSYLEKEHYVPLRIRFWDAHGVETKEWRVDPADIERFGDVWLPVEATMRNLRKGSSSKLFVREVDTEPQFAPATFEVSRLDRGL